MNCRVGVFRVTRAGLATVRPRFALSRVIAHSRSYSEFSASAASESQRTRDPDAPSQGAAPRF